MTATLLFGYLPQNVARPVVHSWLFRRSGGGAFVAVVDQIAGSDST